MGIPVKLTIMVRTDNIGAIFMEENASCGVRTRHIDTRYHFIREHAEDGMINIVIVKTDGNNSDLFRKNIKKDIYEMHMLSS
jgi:sugar/nucleoside kinase (ribokinase family)